MDTDIARRRCWLLGRRWWRCVLQALLTSSCGARRGITPLQAARLPQGCHLPGPAAEVRAPAGTSAVKEHRETPTPRRAHPRGWLVPSSLPGAGGAGLPPGTGGPGWQTALAPSPALPCLAPRPAPRPAPLPAPLLRAPPPGGVAPPGRAEGANSDRPAPPAPAAAAVPPRSLRRSR